MSKGTAKSVYLLSHSTLLIQTRFPIYEHIIIDKSDITGTWWTLQRLEPVVIVVGEGLIQGHTWKKDDTSIASLEKQTKKKQHK